MSYITFSNLGASGGMCSQLQSYASLLAVAKANNKEIVFAKSMKFTGNYNIEVGDLVKFGVSHPCITIDKWKLFYIKNGQEIKEVFDKVIVCTGIHQVPFMPEEKIYENFYIV